MEASKSKYKYFPKLEPIEVLLALLFLVAPFLYFNNTGGTGLRIPFNILVWFVANIIICYSFYIYSIKKQSRFKVPSYLFYVLAFPVLATISGFISGVYNPTEWLFRLLFIWYGLLFFLGLFQHKFTSGQIDRILFFIVISAFLQACIGVVQITLSDIMPAWFPRIRGEVAVLPFGVFQQINNQVTYQATAIVLAVFLITRPYIVKGAIFKQLLMLVFFTCSTFVISYSGSRIGILSVVFALPLAITGRWKYLKINKSLALASVFFAIIGVGLGASGSGFSHFSEKTVQISEGLSGSARIGIYAVSIDLIKEEPLFGHGIGNFKYKWQYEKAAFYAANPDAYLISSYLTHPHNELLFWMIEGGVVATFGIFLLVAGVFLTLKRHNQKRWGVYLGFLLPIILHTQVELPFYTSAVHWFLVLTLLFIIMRTSSRDAQPVLSVTAKKLVKVISVGMGVLATVFLSHSMIANYEMSKKGNDIWNLSVAQANPYFSELIESMQMKNLFLFNQSRGITHSTQSYVIWAEKFLYREPSPQMFVLLALAYQDINKKDEMCRVFKLGNNIYPRNKPLGNGVKHCD